MKKSMLFSAVILAFTLQAFAQTHPGSSNLSARITDIGEEFGYGEMVSTMSMFLFYVQGAFERTTEDVKNGDDNIKGPDNITYGLTILPETRFYSKPDNRVSPFFGVFGLFGYRGVLSEFIQGGETIETNTTELKVGAGFSVGAEFFVNEFLSLSLDSRLFKYQYKKASTDKDYADSTIKEETTGHHVSLDIEPAVYVRVYF